MQITTRPKVNTRIPGVPSKPLDNPARQKPAYSSDVECAGLLERLLRKVPTNLAAAAGSAHPLLDSLFTLDAIRGTDVARQLIFVAAATHLSSDERRTAEYLLRNRSSVADEGRTPLALLLAARCAAEMDVRHVQSRETPVPFEALTLLPFEEQVSLVDAPAVGDAVLEKLRAATGHAPATPLSVTRFCDAVAIALELAERHQLNGGKGPSLLGMRSDARKDARLVTQLRREFGNERGARALARLLIGADGTPIENALLWWCARSSLAAEDVPALIRCRWVRYLRAAEAAFTSAQPSKAAASHIVELAIDARRIYPLQSGIPDVGDCVPPITRRAALRHEPVVRKAEPMVDQTRAPQSAAS